LIAGVLCIGSSPIFVRLADVPGPVSAFWRMAFAAAGLVVLSLVRRERWPARGLRCAIALGGVFFAADLSLWNQSLLQVPVAVCTPVGNSAPLWVGLGAWIAWKRRPSSAFWTGLFLAMAGMLVLSGEAVLDAGRYAGGLAMALAASVFYAFYLMGTSKVRSRTTTLSFTTFSTLASVAVLFPLNIGMGQNLFHLPSQAWWALLGLGLVAHLAGWLLINYALGHLPAENASITLLGQTVVATIAAVPLLGEIPDVRQLAGGALVLAGIWWASRRSGG
jgi:drug/metabolite transporter (DMT)-like permease